MATNRKELGPFDHAAMDVLDELRGMMSGRELERLSGIMHNRMAVILRRDSPPATVGEVDRMAVVLGTEASTVIEEAERRLGRSKPVPLPVWTRAARPIPEDFGLPGQAAVDAWMRIQPGLDEEKDRHYVLGPRRSTDPNLDSALFAVAEYLECLAQWERARGRGATVHDLHPAPVSDDDAMMQEPLAAQARDVQRELEGHEDSI